MNYIFSQLADMKNPQLLYQKTAELSRANPYRMSLWFNEFDEAYEIYKTKTKIKSIIRQIEPYFKHYTSFLDFGCGSGDLAQHIATHYGKMKVSGIDVLDWRTPEIKESKSFTFYKMDILKPTKVSIPRHDIGMMYAVLHHVGNKPNDMILFLNRAKLLIGEKIIVVEDVVFGSESRKLKLSGIDTIKNAASKQPDFKKFLSFDLETQKGIINIVDFLSNALIMGVEGMNFPFGCQKLTDWCNIFESAGFKTDKLKILGFQPHYFHRISNALFVLSKN